MTRKNQKNDKIRELVGGPLNEATINEYFSYLDENGKPVPTLKGDRIRQSGKGGLDYNRGAYYEWNNK